MNDVWPFVGRDAEITLALEMLDGSPGFIVDGPSGGGRSRYLSEVVDSWCAPGRVVVRAVGSEQLSSIPLGALSHLLPAGIITSSASVEPFDRARILENAVVALTPQAGIALLVVDDAHLLDGVSLALLHQLSQIDVMRLALSARSDDPSPEGLSVLSRTHGLGRIELPALTASEMSTLLSRGLASAIDGRADRAFVRAGAGNPQLMREIVRSAMDVGVLTSVDGVWRLDGPIPTARRSVQAVARRLHQLDVESRAVLELLVLVGETSLSLLGDVASAATLEALEEAGFLAVSPGAVPGDDRVVVERQVVADAVRDDLSSLRSRSILRLHAERFEAVSDGSDDHRLRLARWRLDAGVVGAAVELENAATLARLAEDFVTAARFAEAADAAEGTLRSAVLWGDSLYELCRWEDCERVLSEADDRPGSAADRLRLVAARGTNLLFGLMRGSEAVARTREALANFDAGLPQWHDDIGAAEAAEIRQDLVSRIALLQMYNGDPSAALATLGTVPATGSATGSESGSASGGRTDGATKSRAELRSSVLWAIPGVPALALSGRTGAAVALGFQAFEEHAQLGGEVGLSPLGIHLVTLGFALQEHGDFAQAHGVLIAGYEATLADHNLLGQIWFGLNLGRMALLAGRGETANKWAREVLAATGAAGWLGPRRLALSSFAAASALTGDVGTARTAIRDSERIDGEFGFLAPERELASAWVAAAEGRLDEARRSLLDAARSAHVTGHSTSESWLRYEAVRLGSSGSELAEQTARLDELAGGSDSSLVAARAQFVRAMADGDPLTLEAAGVALESLGCDLAASEAFGAAAERLRRNGQQRTANALTLRATGAIGRSEGARSFRRINADVVVPLTRREGEVAGLAAAGLSSKEIADRLYLSVRTVDNHLQNAYTKLGVSSRSEIAAKLTPM